MYMSIKLPNIEDTAYFTVRNLKDNDDKIKGKVVLYRLKGKEEYEFYIICPICGKESQGSKMFKRRPFRLECLHCGYKIVVEKIKPKK